MTKICKQCDTKFEQSEFDKCFPDNADVNLYCSDKCWENSKILKKQNKA
jgi:hypothetical protein